MMKLRIFKVIQPDHDNDRASAAFDSVITTLILLSVVSVFVGTFKLSDGVRGALEFFDAVVSVVFTIEYALRIWTAPLLYPGTKTWRARLRYVFSGMALIDLLSILPFYLPMVMPGSLLGLRAIRLLRILRLLKLNRYFDAVSSLGHVIRRKRRELFGSLVVMFLFMLVSSLLMYTVEHEAQPEVFANAFSGLWWAVATLTTVGYGDIYPVTVLGRIFGALIALSGVAAVAIPSGVITTGLIESLQISQEDDAKTIRCPHCGKRIKLEEK